MLMVYCYLDRDAFTFLKETVIHIDKLKSITR